MFVFTAKLSKSRAVAAVLALGALVCTLIVLSGARRQTESPATALDMSRNESRIDWLLTLGWEVAPEPVETLSLVLPDPLDAALLDYNLLQQQQGFDLTPYQGKPVLRYTYRVLNHPQASGCQINLYLCGEAIIAGDLICPGKDGFVAPLTYPDQ